MRYRHNGPKWKSDPEKMKAVVKGLGELVRAKAEKPGVSSTAAPDAPAPASRVRCATQAETEALLGNGVIIFGGGKPSPRSSEDAKGARSHAPREAAVPEAGARMEAHMNSELKVISSDGGDLWPR